ncbi:ECF transporter S component [Alkalibaculum sp. M08DMB]|uniref:ECF transporter S component n=1 Tax=Alkalibaculum sporogenes TaxID=2655001 RepID=A0A6A7K7J3_9FIRM|nr:ECF transporter S component [Alkalibaculum sporogenes]MPW25374.1 ECF transporter S component [Alkalibaculum sporogenes]
MKTNTKKITYTSLMIALVFLSTVLIPIPSPLGGYINLGDAAIYISSFILGPTLGFLAGGLGSMLGDFSLSYFIYMIPTLLIKGSMGAVSGYFFKKHKYLLGVLSGLFIMVFGYYGAEVIIFYNFLSPLANVPFNLIQGSIGSMVAYLIIRGLNRSKITNNM